MVFHVPVALRDSYPLRLASIILAYLLFAPKIERSFTGTPPNMTIDEGIAKALEARLSELKSRVAKIEGELRKPLSADMEEQAVELENQDALEAIENSEVDEIRQIEEALNRISQGTYGVCVKCGMDIDPKRLRALPTATRCISCAA